MSKRRGPSYTQAEVLHLLTIVREHLPIGQDEWEGVCQEHILAWPNCGRDYLSIRRKFNQLANTHMPTGETVCPPSMQDFFKYSMMMREADRKEIMEEAREERKRREEDDRMFRNLFLATIINGKTTKDRSTDVEPNTK